MLDAGSSHTAMFIYKWPADKENDTGVVSEHSMCDVEGKDCPSPWGPVPGGRVSHVPCGQGTTMVRMPLPCPAASLRIQQCSEVL